MRHPLRVLHLGARVHTQYFIVLNSTKTPLYPFVIYIYIYYSTAVPGIVIDVKWEKVYSKELSILLSQNFGNINLSHSNSLFRFPRRACVFFPLCFFPLLTWTTRKTRKTRKSRPRRGVARPRRGRSPCSCRTRASCVGGAGRSSRRRRGRGRQEDLRRRAFGLAW
jgi:hypothetical protein